RHYTAESVSCKAHPNSHLELLDGRTRLDALELVIVKPVGIGPPSLACGNFVALNRVTMLDGRSVDPHSWVISANLRRRSLTDEQRQNALIKLIARTPKSDREIGKEAGVDHKTIAKARAKGETTGEVSPVEKRVGRDGKARKQPKKAAKGSRSRSRAGAPEAADRDGSAGGDHGDVQGGDRGGEHAEQHVASIPAGLQARLDELAHKVR